MSYSGWLHSAAGRRPVRIFPDSGGLVLKDAEDGLTQDWDYPGLGLYPERTADGALRLYHPSAPGAVLEVPDGGLTRHLRRHAPQLRPGTGGRQRGLKRTLLGVAILVLGIWGLLAALRGLAGVTAGLVPVPWEVALGRSMWQGAGTSRCCRTRR